MLDDDHVTRVEEHPGDQVQALLGTLQDDDLVGAARRRRPPSSATAIAWRSDGSPSVTAYCITLRSAPDSRSSYTARSSATGNSDGSG